MFTNQKEITNVFRTGTVEIDVTECFSSPDHWNPSDCTDKILNICNIGTKAVYVRVKFDPQWECGLPTTNVHYLPWNPDWVKIGKYFYYKKILGSTKEVCANDKCVTFEMVVKLSGLSGNEYQGKMFTLCVKAEAVQAKNYGAIHEWHLDPDDVELIGFEPYPNPDNQCDPCYPDPEPCEEPCEPCHHDHHDHHDHCEPCEPCEPCNPPVPTPEKKIKKGFISTLTMMLHI